MESKEEYPSKNYPTKSGAILDSEQMAKMQAIGIKKLNDELKSTKNPRKVKELRNRLREIKLWIAFHPDVNQIALAHPAAS
jgi:hypothetical protein